MCALAGQPVFQDEYRGWGFGPSCVQALPDSRKGRGGRIQSGRWIMEAPKSWSQFRGLPGLLALWGNKASNKPHRRQRCRKPVAVAEGSDGRQPVLHSFFGFPARFFSRSFHETAPRSAFRGYVFSAVSTGEVLRSLIRQYVELRKASRRYVVAVELSVWQNAAIDEDNLFLSRAPGYDNLPRRQGYSGPASGRSGTSADNNDHGTARVRNVRRGQVGNHQY
jgi:hypothetical protein